MKEGRAMHSPLEIIPLMLPFSIFFFVGVLPIFIIETVKKWFNSPSKRKEKKFFSNRYRYEWR